MQVKDMTKGNELKLIFLFSLPLMLGNIFQQLYTVCDTIIVSRHLGVKALAAIGCSDWLTWMGIAVVTGLAQGFSIPIAHAFGTHDNQKRLQNKGGRGGECDLSASATNHSKPPARAG